MCTCTGVGAFVGALIIGPRRGRFGPSEESAEEKQFRENRYRPHNQVLICTGTLILWLGWYGFNAGSTLMLSANASLIAAKVCIPVSHSHWLVCTTNGLGEAM